MVDPAFRTDVPRVRTLHAETDPKGCGTPREPGTLSLLLDNENDNLWTRDGTGGSRTSYQESGPLTETANVQRSAVRSETNASAGARGLLGARVRPLGSGASPFHPNLQAPAEPRR